MIARTISSGIDAGVSTFAIEGKDDPRYFLLSHDVSPDDQDVGLGLDGLYSEVGDQNFGAYSQLDKVTVLDDAISILFKGGAMLPENCKNPLRIYGLSSAKQTSDWQAHLAKILKTFGLQQEFST